MKKFENGDFIKFKNRFKSSSYSFGVITDSISSHMKIKTLNGNLTINTYDYDIRFIDLSNMKVYEFEVYCKLLGAPYKIKYRGNIITKLKETNESLDYLNENGNVIEFNKNSPCIMIITHTKSILDDIEKKYLTNLLKPLNMTNISIVKKTDYNSDSYYIKIAGNTSSSFYDESILLPNFKRNRNMYNGMELDVKYSIDDLGLEV